MSKFEKLLDLLVNEQKDEAEKLFHEIVVEKSRSIYEGILADEEADATDKSADKDDAEEVDEAEIHDEAENEEPAESTDETIEEIGGDATDDLISDIEAEAEGMDMDDEDDQDGMDHDGDFDDDGDQDGETGEMFEPLEKELDALKSEFAKMMDADDDKPEESVDDAFAESKDPDTIVKEYAEMVKNGHGAEKMGKESGADNKKGPVASQKKSLTGAESVKFNSGAEEKGGVGKALAGDTAKEMSMSPKNAAGNKSVSLETAPKAVEKEASIDNAKSPVASK